MQHCVHIQQCFERGWLRCDAEFELTPDSLQSGWLLSRIHFVVVVAMQWTVNDLIWLNQEFQGKCNKCNNISYSFLQSDPENLNQKEKKYEKWNVAISFAICCGHWFDFILLQSWWILLDWVIIWKKVNVLHSVKLFC